MRDSRSPKVPSARVIVPWPTEANGRGVREETDRSEEQDRAEPGAGEALFLADHRLRHRREQRDVVAGGLALAGAQVAGDRQVAGEIPGQADAELAVALLGRELVVAD